MKVVNSVERLGPAAGCCTGMGSFRLKTRLDRKSCIGQLRRLGAALCNAWGRRRELFYAVNETGEIMLKILQGLHPLVFLVIATTLEVCGDAVVRVAIYNHAGWIRIALFLAGAALLFGYGSFLNLAPVEFGRVVGLYIATLLVVWELINFIAFRKLPT